MFLLNVVLLTELSNLGFTRNQAGKPTLATKVRPPRRNACTFQPQHFVAVQTPFVTIGHQKGCNVSSVSKLRHEKPFHHAQGEAKQEKKRKKKKGTKRSLSLYSVV